jgi:hypothetical protein
VLGSGRCQDFMPHALILTDHDRVEVQHTPSHLSPG